MPPTLGMEMAGIMLSPDRLERLRRALLEERDRLRKDLEGLRPDLLAGYAGAGVGNHMAEDASLTYEQETLLSLRRSHEATLEDVEKALRKLATGTYGVCERCGQEIDFARLKAKPYATLDMNCQKLAELS
jgi:DnaK suppressor protein